MYRTGCFCPWSSTEEMVLSGSLFKIAIITKETHCRCLFNTENRTFWIFKSGKTETNYHKLLFLKKTYHYNFIASYFVCQGLRALWLFRMFFIITTLIPDSFIKNTVNLKCTYDFFITYFEEMSAIPSSPPSSKEMSCFTLFLLSVLFPLFLFVSIWHKCRYILHLQVKQYKQKENWVCKWRLIISDRRINTCTRTGIFNEIWCVSKAKLDCMVITQWLFKFWDNVTH